MRSFFIFLLLASTSYLAQAQKTNPDEQKALIKKPIHERKRKFGMKFGYNVAKVTGKTPDYFPDTKNGFMAAAFFGAASKWGFDYRTELVFSRQGFAFDDNGKANSITSDYIYLPQFTTLGITKFLQLQAGAQIGYLLRSSKKNSSGSESQDITSFANRIDYGAAAGIEIYPTKGLIFGGRYNISFGNMYKQMSNAINSFPLPFNPTEVKSKNAVINLFIGYRF